jgi:hypothetical protein
VRSLKIVAIFSVRDLKTEFRRESGRLGDQNQGAAGRVSRQISQGNLHKVNTLEAPLRFGASLPPRRYNWSVAAAEGRPTAREIGVLSLTRSMVLLKIPIYNVQNLDN